MVFLVPMLVLTSRQTLADDYSAFEMRQFCRGIEAEVIKGDRIYFDLKKFPNALTCWGAFSVLEQQSVFFTRPATASPSRPIFLPSVCPIKDERGVPADVLVKVFTHYLDQHPEEGSEPFVWVALRAFQAAWPCQK